VNKLAECFWWQLKAEPAELLIRENILGSVHDLGPSHPLTGKLYLNLAVTGFVCSTSAMSEEYFMKALQISLGNFGVYHDETAKVYEWLGTTHESIGEQMVSFNYLKKALAIRKKICSPGSPDLGNIYRYMGLFYKRYARHDSAMQYFRKALVCFDKKYGPYNFQSVKCLNNISDLYEEATQYPKALASYNDAMFRISHSSGETKMVKIMTLFNLAEHYYRREDFERSLDFIQKIFPLYFPAFDISSSLSNPVNVTPVYNYYLKLVYSFKADILRRMYDRSPAHPVPLLISALQCDSLVNNINILMKRYIVHDENMLTFEQTHSRMYFTYARDALKIYELTGDTSYISRALSYLEANRNTGWLNDRLAPLPRHENILSIRQSLSRHRTRINTLEHLLASAKDPTRKTGIQDSILDEKISLDQLYFSLREKSQNTGLFVQNYPGLYLGAIMKKLGPRDVILGLFEGFPDYMWIPDQFFLFAATRSGFKYEYVDGRVLYKALNRFSMLVSNPNSSLQSLDSNGSFLYRAIFGPFPALMSGKNNLLIIPSVDTWMVPFGALSTGTTGFSNNRDYLFTKYSIRKEFSLLTWMYPLEKKFRAGDNILAMAPKFNVPLKRQLAFITRRDERLIDLPGSREECREISKLFPTQLLVGYNATKQSFIDFAPSYDVIHLSTHGIPSPNNGQTLMLAFNTNDGENVRDGFLSMYDILNLHLKSKLVVLSACRSALGTINKSEGNINLSRAFNQAGAQSVLVSLWDLSDYSSSMIMPSFYKYLKQGYNATTALRKAQAGFLAGSDKPFTHPFFWAGFDLIGQDISLSGAPVTFPAPTPLYWVLLGILIISLVMFYLLKRGRYPVHRQDGTSGQTRKPSRFGL